MKTHRLTWSDPTVYIESFPFQLCRGVESKKPLNGRYAFNYKLVTCPKCQKLQGWPKKKPPQKSEWR